MRQKLKTKYAIVLLAAVAITGCKTTGGMPTAAEFNELHPHVSYAQQGVRQTIPVIDRTEGKLNARETSLWSSSPQSLFGDRRASQAGDILTVLVEIDDEAEINNSVTEDRQNNENFGINSFFGLPEKINGLLPAGASLSPAVDLSRTRSLSGDGTIRRGEKITLRLAVQVVDVLPNGYLQLSGQQQIMVNNEIRHLQVTGLIRTQDISRQNVITYDKIANAKIYYGGKGQVTDSVKPRIGNKVIQTLLPF